MYEYGWHLRFFPPGFSFKIQKKQYDVFRKKGVFYDKGHFCTRNIVLPEKYTRVKQKSTVRRFVSYFLHIIYIYTRILGLMHYLFFSLELMEASMEARKHPWRRCNLTKDRS